MIRIVRKRQPPTLGKMPPDPESHHPDPERQPLAVVSEQFCRERSPSGLRKLRIGLLELRPELAAEKQQLFSRQYVVKGPELSRELFEALAPVDVFGCRHNCAPPGPGLDIADDPPPTHRHAFMVRQSGIHRIRSAREPVS